MLVFSNNVIHVCSGYSSRGRVGNVTKKYQINTIIHGIIFPLVHILNAHLDQFRKSRSNYFVPFGDINPITTWCLGVWMGKIDGNHRHLAKRFCHKTLVYSTISPSDKNYHAVNIIAFQEMNVSTGTIGGQLSVFLSTARQRTRAACELAWSSSKWATMAAAAKAASLANVIASCSF